MLSNISKFYEPLSMRKKLVLGVTDCNLKRDQDLVWTFSILQFLFQQQKRFIILFVEQTVIGSMNLLGQFLWISLTNGFWFRNGSWTIYRLYKISFFTETIIIIIKTVESLAKATLTLIPLFGLHEIVGLHRLITHEPGESQFCSCPRPQNPDLGKNQFEILKYHYI